MWKHSDIVDRIGDNRWNQEQSCLADKEKFFPLKGKISDYFFKRHG